MSSNWYVYIIECFDGSFYTGVTLDVERRFKEHQSGGKKAAKYMKSHPPKRIIFIEKFKNRSKAQVRESSIKSLSKREKLKLIKQV